MWFTKAHGYDYVFLSFRYKAIVKYKTAFYSFYLPVAAAMYIVSMFVLYINDVKGLMSMLG